MYQFICLIGYRIHCLGIWILVDGLETVRRKAVMESDHFCQFPHTKVIYKTFSLFMFKPWCGDANQLTPGGLGGGPLWTLWGVGLHLPGLWWWCLLIGCGLRTQIVFCSSGFAVPCHVFTLSRSGFSIYWSCGFFKFVFLFTILPFLFHVCKVPYE